MSLSDLITARLHRDHSVWHVRHRLHKSLRSFDSEQEARDYYESLKKAKTRRIIELKPPKELMLESFNIPTPILARLK